MRVLGAAAVCLLSSFASAQTDTEITVLGVIVDDSADWNTARDFLDDVADPYYWMSPTNPIGASVRLANWGIPYPMPGPKLSNGSGTAYTQLQNAIADQQAHNFRLDADVILYFTGSFSPDPGMDLVPCGLAQQINWTISGGSPAGNRFVPGPDGQDRRGSEDSFEAIIATTGTCAEISITAIHEFGHLFGAGHQTTASSLIDYMFLDSHARRWIHSFPDRRRQLRRTIVGAVQPDDSIPQNGSYPAIWVREWSNGVPSNSANNRRTIETSWRSVANYRVAAVPQPPPPPNPPPGPPLPPGCTLQQPVGPQIVLRGVCDPLSETHYRAYWFDVCPGATDYYLLEKMQPIPGSWVPFDSGSTLWPWTEAYIDGPAGQLRVRACNGGGCSTPLVIGTFVDLC